MKDVCPNVTQQAHSTRHKLHRGDTMLKCATVPPEMQRASKQNKTNEAIADRSRAYKIKSMPPGVPTVGSGLVLKLWIHRNHLQPRQ